MPNSVRRDLLQAMRAFAGAQFEILGELGADAQGDLVYLARPRDEDGALVALRVESPRQAVRDGRTVSVAMERDLDALVSGSARCTRCAVPTEGGPLCRSCEQSPLSGELVRAVPGTPVEVAELLAVYRLESWQPVDGARQTTDGTPYFFVLDTTSERVLLLFLRAERPQAGVVLYRPSLAPAFAGAVPLDELPGRQTSMLPTPSASAASAPAASAPPAPRADDRRRSCPQCGATYAGDTLFCPRDGSALRYSAAQASLVGTVIADRYQILDVLGEGGMGKVYLAEHVKIRRRCAFKVMSQSLAQDADAVGRFVREAENAARVNHPNVAAVYDFGETPDGLAYLAMELVEGEPLSRALARDGTLPPARAAELSRQVALGLAAAHELGIVHRDLKPDNVMLTRGRDGRDVVKVVDFGIAKAGARQTQQITRTGMVLGTPEYMSPEQLLGETLDGRTDIYSLGCILYRLLTGRAPFASKSGELALGPRLSGPPPRPGEVVPGLPAAMDAVVLRAMAVNPGERFQSAAELAEALAPLASGAATASGPAVTAPSATSELSAGTAGPLAAAADAGVPRTDERPAARRPVPKWAAAAVLLLAAGGAAGAFALIGGEDGAPVAPPVVLAADSSAATSLAVEPVPESVAPGAAPGGAGDGGPAPAGGTQAATQTATQPTTRPPAAGRETAGAGPALRTPAPGGAPAVEPVRGGGVAGAAGSAETTAVGSPAAAPPVVAPPVSVPVPVSVPAPQPVAATPPAPADDGAARLAAARAAAPGVVERYERAIAQRSLALLRESYPQLTREQREAWGNFFDHPRDVKELRADLSLGSVSGEREPFTIEFSGTLTFRDSRNAEQRVAYRARGRLAQANGAWILDGVTDSFGR